MALVDNIIAYETGELSHREILRLFSELVKNGKTWVLQGSYGRTARAFIEAGYLDRQGNIIKDI